MTTTSSVILCLLCLATWQGSTFQHRGHVGLLTGSNGSAWLNSTDWLALSRYSAVQHRRPVRLNGSAELKSTDWLALSRYSADLAQPEAVQMRGEAPTQEGESWRLFLGSAPGEEPGTIGPEVFGPSLDNPVAARCCPGDTSRFFFNVSTPLVAAFLLDANAANRTDAAVIILPGGGYDFLAWEKEGTEIAVWLNSLGVSAFVLKYRVPTRPGHELSHQAPVQDGQRAISLVRHHAAVLGINKARIGVMGFSAGGDLAVLLSTTTQRMYPPADEADAERFTPDFQMLIYGARIPTPVGATPPPTFLAATEDDQCVPSVLVRATAAWLQLEGAFVDLNVYPSGRHGWGDCMMYTETGEWESVCQWTARAAEFINDVVLETGR